MIVTISAEMEEFVRRKLRSGSYDSPAQIVEEALMLLEERDFVIGLRRDRLLHELANGVFQANNRELVESDQVFAKLRSQENGEGG